MDIGRSYCHDCKIRYSKTENGWVCSRLTLENRFCEGLLDKNNKCCKEHSTNEVRIISTSEKSEKYPYKTSVEITK